MFVPTLPKLLYHVKQLHNKYSTEARACHHNWLCYSKPADYEKTEAFKMVVYDLSKLIDDFS